VKVIALAALLVTATALAQTPPAAPVTPGASAAQPGAPVAQPGAPTGGRYVTDAEVQREIDAQVAAAKKELREEMRAQAATVAATSAGGSWEAEAAARRKLDLVELHGYFRVRPELLQGFDLSQPVDASGYWLFPRPNGTGTPGGIPSGGHSVAGTNMRFQLNPTINVSEEVRIRAQINALDNVVWGSTPDYAYVSQNRTNIGILSETGVPNIPGVNSTQSNIAVTRVWGEVATPVGLLKFGRMGDQFGMGIVHNDGNCLDCNYGVTVDRFEFVAEPLPGFLVVPMLDFNVEGLVGGQTNTQGQPYDVTNSDDSHTFGIILARKDSDLKARAKIDAGGSVINYGFYFQYRSQTWEYTQNGTGFYVQDPYTSPSPSLSRVPRSAYLFIPDLWFKFENRSFRVEFEVAAYLGKAQACQSFNGGTAGVNPCLGFNQQLTIAQYGGALQTEYRLLDGALKIGLEIGAASGDKAPGFGDKPNRPTRSTVPNTTGAQWGDYDGAQYGRRPCVPGTQAPICIDNDIRNFRFNPDYRIDLILWRDIIGGITDAAYIRLPVSYNINDSFSVFGNFVYSRMIDATSTPSGTSTALGIELDAGVKYQSDDGFYAQLAYGILFPFDALKYQFSLFPQTASIAQAIRAQLGIRF